MKRNIIFILITLFIFSGSFAAQKKKDYEALKPLMEVYSIIKNSYVDEEKTAPKELVEAAIKGMVGHIDPFSQYLDPQAYKDMTEDTKAEFGGLGIEISIRDGQLTVVAPIEDTPAYDAGIKAGDKIMAIEGESTKGIDIMDAVHKLRGKPGTDVTISVQRGHDPEWKDYTITRAIIKIKTARHYVLGDVGYIRINEFMGDAAGAVKKALDSFEKEKIDKLIIDLRNNPGGLLNQSVRVADLFLPKGDVVVTTEGRIKEQAMKFKSESRPEFKGNIVVMVNKGSASASEILAGAIRDNDRGVLIGEKTFGKGSVQTIIPLSDKSALRLTTAQYFTPSGGKIHGLGIKPDIVLEEPVPTDFSAGLYDENYFGEFAAVYLERHPKGIKKDNGDGKSVEVSESDIKVFFKKKPDDELLDDFKKWIKSKDVEIKIQDLARDRETILKWIKTEIARKIKGRAEARRASIENDVQIRRAINVLNTISRLTEN